MFDVGKRGVEKAELAGQEGVVFGSLGFAVEEGTVLSVRLVQRFLDVFVLYIDFFLLCVDL